MEQQSLKVKIFTAEQRLGAAARGRRRKANNPIKEIKKVVRSFHHHHHHLPTLVTRDNNRSWHDLDSQLLKNEDAKFSQPFLRNICQTQYLSVLELFRTRVGMQWRADFLTRIHK